ncbi:Frizzy aggregation protein FrzCD [Enhygromyxa salina]|uniref:Frizzy aggregation protein FrzCD n=1 Tax=Enhygromyxa salina TaxID=215803 RepID=A0A2S9YHZ3_9BACT|nr:HAMP domain-containing methyl-accepting chemotaxis protein [Enhygromyxa salina]PRQ04681.1 Frizzy aggregation protein FrzCD [Enhygromyxa salina]
MRDWTISWRTVVRFQLIESPFLILLTFGWVSLLSVELRSVLAPAAVVSVLRLVTTVASLRVLLRPVDGWREAARVGDDARLLAAGEAIRRAPTRFMGVFSIAWTGSFVLATAYVWFAMADRAPIGRGELTAVGLMCVAILTGAWSFAFSVTSRLLGSERVALSRALIERGLGVSAPRTSLSARLLVLMLGYVLASGSLIAVAGVSNNAAFNRSHAISELARVGSSEAARIAAGHPPEHGTILRTAELPPIPQTAAIDELPELGAMRVVLDRRRAQASVAVPLERDRWLLVEGPVERKGDNHGAMLLAFALVLALWGPITAVLTTRSMIDPLREIEAAMRRVVEVGDISQVEHLPIIHEDELGALTHSFNGMVDNLRGLSEAALLVAAGDLSILVEQRGELPDAFRGMLEQLHEIVVEIRATAVDVAAASAEIYAAAQGQEAAAAETSSKVREMSATVGSLAESAEQITTKANDVLLNAERTLATTDEVVAKINQLSARANGVGDLLEAIRDVADRSDLLALNGSLEATRAGEAGRGFALVAAEMRRLAERVTGTVADVRVQVADIEGSGVTTVLATEENRQLADDTAGAAREIFEVTRKQSEDTAQVSLTMQTMTEFVLTASVSTSQTRAAVAGLRQRVEELDRLTRQFELRGDA